MMIRPVKPPLQLKRIRLHPYRSVGRRLVRLWILHTPLALGLALSPMTGLPAEDRPILKESPARMVAVIESTGRANFVAACLNVTRDAAQKRMRIFAVSPKAKTGLVKEEDFEIEVIYHPELTRESKAAGPYHQHHNHMVLRFAAAQFAAGKKVLGRRMVRLLAEADPDLWWSSPTHPPVTIQQILAGLEGEADRLKEFLKEESDDWGYRINNYR